MTIGTMDGKTTSHVRQPSFTIIQQSEDNGHSAGGKKSRVTRKHVTIGVTCAVMVAMVITGFLIGVKFYLDSANEIVTRAVEAIKENKEKLKVDVGADVKDNYVQYHMKDEDKEIWMIADFNRELQVVKMRHSAGVACFIATLNSSESASPSAILNATASEGTLRAVEKYYEVSETSIKDKSMLGRHGQELCDNLDVHWMTKVRNDDSARLTKGHSREKRWWPIVVGIILFLIPTPAY